MSCFPHWHIHAMNDGSTITPCRPRVRQPHIHVLMEQRFVPRVPPLFGTSILWMIAWLSNNWISYELMSCLKFCCWAAVCIEWNIVSYIAQTKGTNSCPSSTWMLGVSNLWTEIWNETVEWKKECLEQSSYKWHLIWVAGTVQSRLNYLLCL